MYIYIHIYLFILFTFISSYATRATRATCSTFRLQHGEIWDELCKARGHIGQLTGANKQRLANMIEKEKRLLLLNEANVNSKQKKQTKNKIMNIISMNIISIMIWITDFFALVDDCVLWFLWCRCRTRFYQRDAWTWRRSNETPARHNGRALPEALPPIRPGTLQLFRWKKFKIETLLLLDGHFCCHFRFAQLSSLCITGGSSRF